MGGVNVGDSPDDATDRPASSAPEESVASGRVLEIRLRVPRVRPPSISYEWVKPRVVLATMIALYVAYFGVLTWAQQSNFGTFDFDLGIFDQQIWLAAHHLNALGTVRGLPLWANHVNPVIYLLVPFYWLGAGPHFLYLVQVAAIASVAVPLYQLARARLHSDRLALVVPFAWLLYPANEWMTWWAFHPEYLALPAFVYAYWFADRRRWWPYWVCVALVLSTKEDAALAVIALGALLLARRQTRVALATIGVAAAWFVISVRVIMPLATPNATQIYLYMYSQFGTSFWSILVNIVRHPSHIVNAIFTWSHVHYYEQLALPLGLLFVLSPVTLILVVPTFLLNVANNQGYPADIRFQYTTFIATGLFIAMIEGLGRVTRRGLLVLASLVLAGASLITNATYSPSSLNQRVFNSGVWALQPSAQSREATTLLRRIPANAAVSASYNIEPHLTHRDRIYTWPNPWVRSNYGVGAGQPPESGTDANYLLVFTSENTSSQLALLHRLTRPRGPFRVLADRHGVLLAVRKGRDAAG